MTRLPSAANATAYQKKWFADTQRRAADGEPLVLVNADAPQEILRAMELPYVVNQWWASVVGSRGQASACLDVMRAQGYPDFSRQYDAISLGSVHLAPDVAPWGGLPRPSVVVAELSGDAAGKVFELWENEDGTVFHPWSARPSSLRRTAGGSSFRARGSRPSRPSGWICWRLRFVLSWPSWRNVPAGPWTRSDSPR